MTNRFLDAVKQTLSLEGLVGTLIGGGVWAIAAAAFNLIPKLGLAASIVAGAGAGLLAVAGFVWLVVIPRRAQEQERVDVLKSSARRHLLTFAEEGAQTLTGVTEGPSEGKLEWQRRAYSFVLDAFGRDRADEFQAEASVRTQVQMLREWNRQLDDLPLRRGYAGGVGR